ncbi:MAG TPA: metalloregulator ArsR/SmtB family transcription factor, partial [Desulfitobacteriaceae bacterium]|nr:metalloregulator ArsR/SmtB family transcription factor [Desulfitobacteriaceae bacterium]
QQGAAEMTDMGNQLVANIFKALSHPTRLKIMCLLKEKPLCVCHILPQLDSEPSNTSQHLAVLKNQGLVEGKKDGTMVLYRISSPEVYEMIDMAEKIILRQIEETKCSLQKTKILRKVE